MARLDRKLQVTWSELKVLAAKKFVGFHSYETSNAHEIYIIEDGKPAFWAWIFKDTADPRYSADDLTDWTDNHEASANGPTKPRDYDGKDKIQPVTLSTNQWHYWHSVGDTSSALRAGPHFTLTHTGASSDDEALEWRYRDPAWMAGGELRYAGALAGDHISFCVFAPATGVVANEGNTGNCNLVFPGVIVPAAGNGAYDVDLDDCHPVPAPDVDGFWDYALPANMKFGGTVTPSGTPGSAKFHLIAARFDLTRFVADELLLGDGSSAYSPENINASLCLPEWRFECALHNESGSHTVTAVWRVLVSRYWTTV